MPRYKANRDTLLSHESRIVKAGDEFDTTFPKVKGPDGKEVDMKLGDNIELVAEAPKGKKAAADDKKADDKKADDKKADDKKADGGADLV